MPGTQGPDAQFRTLFSPPRPLDDDSPSCRSPNNAVMSFPIRRIIEPAFAKPCHQAIAFGHPAQIYYAVARKYRIEEFQMGGNSLRNSRVAAGRQHERSALRALLPEKVNEGLRQGRMLASSATRRATCCLKQAFPCNSHRGKTKRYKGCFRSRISTDSIRRSVFTRVPSRSTTSGGSAMAIIRLWKKQLSGQPERPVIRELRAQGFRMRVKEPNCIAKSREPSDAQVHQSPSRLATSVLFGAVVDSEYVLSLPSRFFRPFKGSGR